MIEKLDVFDEIYAPLDPPVASIDEVHQKGLWHQTFACWLVNPEKGTVILQLRGPKNKIDPGSYDASAGGHLAAGEKPDDGFRELKEEIGVEIPASDRVYLGMFRNIALRGSYINHEFCHVYLAKCELSIDKMVLEAGEVDAVFEVKIGDAIALFTGKAPEMPVRGVEWDGQKNRIIERKLTTRSMCNYRERCVVSNYYLKVMLAAQGLKNGERLLVI